MSFKNRTYSLFFTLFLTLYSFALVGQNVTVFGIGRLGLTIALSLEKAGYHVLGVDVFPEYVEMINNKTLNSPEPYINEYLQTNRSMKATTSIKEGIDFSDLYLIVVSTTTGVDGYDFKALTDLLTSLNSYKLENKHVVICSTLYPGYIKNNAAPLLKDCKNIDISYNPPFIAQGDIVNGLRKPDMVLIGQANEEVGQILEGLYRKVCLNDPQIARMSVESAEIAKLALNCFVTAKIAFANLVADIADETPGADKNAILKAIGKDQRIGLKCLAPGYGFGGPCFIRDNRALSRYASSIGIEPLLFRATDSVNDLHAHFMAKKLLQSQLPEYVFKDVCYKPNCPVKILEGSQVIEVAKLVAEQGGNVTIQDTDGVVSQMKNKFGDLFNYSIQE